MGSANPVVFLENGFEEKINHFAPLFAGSICNDAGQFCTKPGLFFIPSGEKGDELAARLTAEVMDSRPFLMLHPSIKNNFERLKKERSIFSPKTFIEKDGELHPMQGKPAILTIDSKLFINETTLQEEVFGPFALIIRYENLEDLSQCLNQLHGQLTGSIISKTTTDATFIAVLNIFSQKVGRIILNAIPTGVRVDEAMHHGGPYPAASDSRFTAVGTQSIYRFLRNITFQNFD
jgi:NADP-dependent aldehyde dehydrogenase